MSLSVSQESKNFDSKAPVAWWRVVPAALAITSLIGFNACADENPGTVPATPETSAPAPVSANGTEFSNPASEPDASTTTEPFIVLTAPETTAPLDPELAWFGQQIADPGVVRISDVPLLPTAGIVLEGQGISDFVLGEKEADDLKVLQPEFMLGFEHQSGLLVNIYKGDQMRSDLGVSNGMPDISMGSPEAVSIMLNYAMDHIRRYDTVGYISEEELGIIETLNETRRLTDNVLNIVMIKEGRLCPEDMYPQPASADDACMSGGGLEMIRQPKPHTSAIMVMYVPDSFSPEDKEAYIMGSLAHEFGHYVMNVSGAHWRHNIEVYVKADEELKNMGVTEENRQAVLDSLIYTYGQEQIVNPEEAIIRPYQAHVEGLLRSDALTMGQLAIKAHS